MTAQPETPVAPVSELPVVPRINSSDVDSDLRPFELVYRKDGEEVVETLHYRADPPFGIYSQWEKLRVASRQKVPDKMWAVARPFLLMGMPHKDATRLITLVEGDEADVGVVSISAIGDVIELIRKAAYEGAPPVPQSPGSSNGQRKTGRSSSAKKSSAGSRSTGSRRGRR